MRPFTTIIRRTRPGLSYCARQRNLNSRQLSTSTQSATSTSTTNAILYSVTAVVISAGIWSSGYKQGYDLVADTLKKPDQQLLVTSSTQDAVSEEKKPIQESVAAPPKEDEIVPEPVAANPAQVATKTSTQDTTPASKQDEVSNMKQDATKPSPQDASIEKHLATIAQLDETARLQFQEIQHLKKVISSLREAIDLRNDLLKKQQEAVELLMKSKNYPKTITHRFNRQ